MLYALLIALVAINVGYLVKDDRKDKRERAERADLLQRIQAPQAAAVAHHAARVGPPADDEGLPMSDAEISERQQREQALSWMEQVENGRLSVFDGVPE